MVQYKIKQTEYLYSLGKCVIQNVGFLLHNVFLVTQTDRLCKAAWSNVKV